MITTPKEKQFLNALKSLFTGAKVDGNSGFVNLMKMKQGYFESISPKLMKEIDGRVKDNTSFREELFDKLYTFFSRYFCESGSIYFRHLPAFAKTYEQVYKDGQDVSLLWKTRMLYYVKSDVMVRSMPVDLQNGRGGGGSPNCLQLKKFFFDASEIEHKQNNEKRDEFVFTFSGVKDEQEGKVLHLKVAYSQKGRKTKADEILKESRKADIHLTEDELYEAIGVFCRQTEVDFFINKDARGFLREQFDMWLYQYMFHEETIFDQKRLSQLQAIKNTAYDIIDFIAQFEDELCRVWEKPKFVRNVNYVVTLDRLTGRVLKNIIKHQGVRLQIEEWQKLGMVDNTFTMETIVNSQKGLSDKYRFLPLDTQHFKDLELEILDSLGNLDEMLDGELVHSENWQALNTLQKRYRTRVQCIYIDPPFNLDSSNQFLYRTNYKDANWATLLENRLQIAKKQLNEKGSIFVRCDYHGNWIVRCLLDEIFDYGNLRLREIILRKANSQGALNNFNPATESLFYYPVSISSYFSPIFKSRNREIKWVNCLSPKENKEKNTVVVFGKEYKCPSGQHWRFSQEKFNKLSSERRLRINEKTGIPQYLESKEIPVDTNWTDIQGYTFTTGFQTENSEQLLKRVINSISKRGDIIFDFFLGSGTTIAVAHKLGRKWLGVEMGEHFHTVVLPRMKKVLSYDKTGISKEVKEYQGGGAFKYYSLEQYEETLKNSRYENGKQLELDSEKSSFEQYVFSVDDKLAHVVQPQKEGKLNINLHDLYPDIDIAETLANGLGKNIRKRMADSVIFEDGTTQKTNPAKMTEEEQRDFISSLKTYLWWGE